ncbi:kinase-like domain-containing protein [Glomus cerebriforme]|uniref:Kinase-like domain-containing protein n=1 Tax=Glomus cerebriforme TaxID=658196 RepID=A0A397THN0_9GLOM|nr:kinase-like domain-containing protein [Glomus cerebriforme]
MVHALSAYPLGFVKFWGLTRRPVPKIIESISEKNSLPPSNAVLLVLEFATHGTLHDFLSSKKSMDWTEKINIALLIATGINKALHSKGIAHRDLHSGNILMLNVPDGNTPSIRGCVTDVGLSGYVRIENAMVADEQEGVFGVLPYIAPEVLGGEPYTLAADVYSFGIILWQIAANKLPFRNRAHDISLKNSICNGLRENRVPQVPKDYEDMYMRCWDADPKKRPTIDDVMWELERMWEDSVDGKLSTNEEGADVDDDGPKEKMDKNLDNSQVHSTDIHPNTVYHSRFFSTTSECTLEFTMEDSEICWQQSFTRDVKNLV